MTDRHTDTRPEKPNSRTHSALILASYIWDLPILYKLTSIKKLLKYCTLEWANVTIQWTWIVADVTFRKHLSKCFINLLAKFVKIYINMSHKIKL